MPRRCTICDHLNREAIDQHLVAGEAFRRIATDFNVSEEALRRHQRGHLPARLAQAHQAQELAQATVLAQQVQQQAEHEITQADSLLDRLLALHQETLAILAETRTGNNKDNATALKAIARAEKQLELEGRLIGELQDGTTVNIAILPEWQTIRGTLLQALIPYPEARAAVAEALIHGIKALDGNGLSH